MASVTINKARILAAAGVAATWPAWRHFVKFGWHAFDLGILIFVSLLGYYFYLNKNIDGSKPADSIYIYAGWLVLGLYIFSYKFLPPLGSAILAVELLACFLIASFPKDFKRKPTAFLALFPLMLPLETALQFVIGYPFRKITAHTASFLLSIYGTSVKGTTLYYGKSALEVDAACSGVLGLWAFMIAGASLALILNYNIRKTAVTLFLSFIGSMFYNVLRTSILFLSKNHLGEESQVMHTAIGTAAFFIVITLLLMIFFKRYERLKMNRIGKA